MIARPDAGPCINADELEDEKQREAQVTHMWLIKIHLIASESNHMEHPELGKARGAYVCCFINFPDRHGAIELAKYYSTDDGLWLIEEVFEQKWVMPSDLNLNEEDTVLLNEAAEEGYACAHFIYTESAEDEAAAKTEAESFGK